MTHNIIAMFQTPKAHMTRAGRIVLVQRDNAHDTYVTGWQGAHEDGSGYETSWCTGHYFSDHEAAKKDFVKRVLAHD